MPYYGEGPEAEDKMLEHILQSIHPKNLVFEEGS